MVHASRDALKGGGGESESERTRLEGGKTEKVKRRRLLLWYVENTKG